MGAAVPLIFITVGIVLVVVGILVWWFYLRKSAEEEDASEPQSSIAVFDTSTVTQEDKNEEVQSFQSVGPPPEVASLQNTGDPFINLIKDPNTWIDLGIGAAGNPQIIDFMAEQVVDGINVRRGFEPETATGRIMRLVKSVAPDKTPSILGRMGAIGDSKAVKKALEKSGVEVAETAAQRAAVRAGTKLAVATPLKFAMQAFEAVDFVGLVLDQFLGAYSDTVPDADYFNSMRDYAIEIFKKNLEDQGETWPIITGPMDKFSRDEYLRKEADLRDEIMKSDIGIRNAYLQVLVNARNQGATDEERRQYMDAATEEFFKPRTLPIHAERNNGKVIVYRGTPYITYRSKADADASYDWPLKPNQLFSMWTDQDGGYSYVGPGAILMNMCGSYGEIGKDVTINKDTYTCCVSGTVCRQNGTEPAGGCYCKIEESQRVLELLFGTTIVRGLKQLFDPTMYEDCPEGSEDTGLTCLSSNFQAESRKAAPARCDRAGDGWFASVPGVGALPDLVCAKCPSRFPYHKAATCYKNKSDADSANLGAIEAPEPSCPPDGYPDYTKRTSRKDPLCYHKDVDTGLAGELILVKGPRYACQDGYNECPPLRGFCYPQGCCVRGGPHHDPRRGCIANTKLPKPRCEPGYYYTAGMCYAESHNAKKTCPDGFELNNDGAACVKSVPIPAGPGNNRAMTVMGNETCPEGYPYKPDDSALCYADCKNGYEPDPAVPSMCRSKKAFGVMWKKRKVPFAKPNIKNSPFGKMMDDIQNCTNSACRAKVAVFMGLSVLPIMYNTGAIDILNITYDLQNAYTEGAE